MADATNITNGLGSVVDPGCRIQEEIGEILPFMPDGSASKQFVKYARSRGPGAPRANVYSGISAFPLAAYKRAQGGEKPVLDTPVVETIGADTVNSRRTDYGIDHCILNPTENLGLAEVNNDRYAVAIARGYNDWLLNQIDEHASLSGHMIVAPQNPARAAAEIDRVGSENDIRGLHLPATGLRPSAGHLSYDPIYEAAERADLPITLYPTVGLKSYHQQYSSSQWFAEDYTYHPSFALIEHITSLLFEGVPVKYPELQFLIQGAGLGFGSYLAQRLDDHYLELGYEIPVLEELPSKYLDQQFFWCTSPIGTKARWEDYLAKMIRMLGVDNVIYTSDLPHQFGESPAAFMNRIDDEFSTAELSRLLGSNAADVYGL